MLVRPRQTVGPDCGPARLWVTPLANPTNIIATLNCDIANRITLSDRILLSISERKSKIIY